MLTPNVCTSSHCCPETKSMKKALRETQTLRALAVVRFGHRPPAYPSVRPLQTGPITIHCAAKLSAKCNQVCHCFKLSLRGYNCTNQVTYFIQMHLHTHTHTLTKLTICSFIRCPLLHVLGSYSPVDNLCQQISLEYWTKNQFPGITWVFHLIHHLHSTQQWTPSDSHSVQQAHNVEPFILAFRYTELFWRP